MTSGPFGFSAPALGDDPNSYWKTPLVGPSAAGGATDPASVTLAPLTVMAPAALSGAAPVAAAPTTAPSSLSDAISTIPAKYGVDPAYITKMARAESGGNLNARAATSSAAGPYQIIGSTADSLGISRADRYDPIKATDAISRFTADNAAGLKSSGFEPTHGNLYLSHFAGLGGARSVLGADPSTPVSQILPASSIAANPFLKGMSAGDLTAWADKKMGGPAVLPGSMGSTAQYGAFSLGGVQGRGGAVGGSTPSIPSVPSFGASAGDAPADSSSGLDPMKLIQAITGGQNGQGGQAGAAGGGGQGGQQQGGSGFRVQAPRPRPFALMRFNQFGGFGR